VAQPELKFAFPSPEAGAQDQSFRLIVRPDLWSDRFRLRFTNTFGTQPVTIDGVFLGLQASAGTVVSGTNRRVTFGGGRRELRLPVGQSAYSDRVDLDWVTDRSDARLWGRKLAVSFHVVGFSGPMTWHAKAMQTSYISAPGAGSHGADELDTAFPNSTTSWYFLDALDAWAPSETAVVAALGDSITDGTGSTLNGDDRWPDVLARRLHARFGNHVSLVNEGIGGNQILGPSTYTPQMPFSGGPAALQRLDRDIFGLSGISSVVFLEGINDLGSAGASAEAVIAGIQELVRRVHAHHLKIVGCTLTSSLNSTNPGYGTPEVNQRRQAINAFIRTSGIFDSVADFDAVTVDPQTGELRAEFQPNSTTATIDRLHPNRAGYLAMGNAVDLTVLAPRIRDVADG
jgi:lysophospholipase L1-like esterase